MKEKKNYTKAPTNYIIYLCQRRPYKTSEHSLIHEILSDYIMRKKINPDLQIYKAQGKKLILVTKPEINKLYHNITKDLRSLRIDNTVTVSRYNSYNMDIPNLGDFLKGL